MKRRPRDEPCYLVLPLITVTFVQHQTDLCITAHHADERSEASLLLAGEVVVHQVVLLHPLPHPREEGGGLWIVRSVVWHDVYAMAAQHLDHGHRRHWRRTCCRAIVSNRLGWADAC